MIKRGVLEAGHAAWRLLPQTVRRNAMTGFAARLARRPDQPAPAASRGIIVAGDVGGANGLAESARIIHHVIAAHGLARGLIPLGLPSVVPVNTAPVPPDAALLAVVNAPLLPVGLLRLPRRFIAGRSVLEIEVPLGDYIHAVITPMLGQKTHRMSLRADGLRERF